MNKSLTECFEGFLLKKEEESLLSFLKVCSITNQKGMKTLRVRTESERIIPKSMILSLEERLSGHCFPDTAEYQVRFDEHYTLSSQYTLKNLMDVYKESLEDEIAAYIGEVQAGVLRKAEIHIVSEHEMDLVLQEGFWSKTFEGQITEFLKKVLLNRFSYDTEIQVSYTESDHSKRKAIREEREHRLMQERAKSFATAEIPLEGRAEEEKPGEGERTSEAGDLPPWEAPSAPPKTPPKQEKKAEAPKEGRKDTKRRSFFKTEGVEGLIYGKDFKGEISSIESIEGEGEEVVLSGMIRSVDFRLLRNKERYIVSFDLTDFTDTITVKFFLDAEFAEELMAELKKGKFVRVKGTVAMDKYDHELQLSYLIGIHMDKDRRTHRGDHSLEKRVELHCHTQFSEMDGIASVEELIDRAKEYGHPALAITDNGCAFGFPAAFHKVDKKDEFKVIYGMEANIVDDIHGICFQAGEERINDTAVIFDLETTGFHAKRSRIIEIGAVKIRNGIILDRFSTYVNPEVPIPFAIEELTGINDYTVKDAETIEKVLPKFLEFIGDAYLVAHNAVFDVSFLSANAKRLNLPFSYAYVDTVGLSRYLLPSLKRHRLNIVAKELGVSLEHHHRAVDDAEATAEIYRKLLKILFEEKTEIEYLKELNSVCTFTKDTIRKLPAYTGIVLVKNETGRVNLYRMISVARLEYFNLKPKFPRSMMDQYREGLIFGSGCSEGELYQAILRGESEETIQSIVQWYDYLEVQPTDLNASYIGREGYSIDSVEDLREINREIVRLGELYGKKVVATGDVHYLDPADSVYRAIIMEGKKVRNSDVQPPLYYRTTEEMLDEFSYLGSEKAYEIVVTNPRSIADSIERIAPVRPDKCPPVIPHSDEDLRAMCREKAVSMYGDPLPEIVEARLNRELDSIISNGYSVMYIIAQKLVWKSNEDGYLVGSRGSVGSSFVATMAGITEVNPLPPHYYCPNCKYSDFDSETVRSSEGLSGCDMPDAVCPHCGTPLKKDGFDIPFETFLGFYGDKEPDIDLNFSGEYQSRAHAYTEEIFGKGYTFRAGTIGTLAEKTAFAYVKSYLENRNLIKRRAEILRMAERCTGVRRSTGQHPGGIIVLPHGEDICSFTPIQHPADDMNTDIITTHFDYHSIDHNLLKLDILGHDDPTMIRKLEDLTGINAREIPLDDEKVMSLFQSTEALGIRPEDIAGRELGALGIPEFGTDFAMGMLKAAKPRYFSDLVRIAGLAHGTDVWLNNAEVLIREGIATIQTCISTRDDIMTYLIAMGLEKGLSFKIMESVRKGKGLSAEWEEEMRSHEVPEWYIDSCNRIKYMFPKAHAAAYVMMAWRIAWFKLYYPLQYYAAYFSIRAKAFIYDDMALGKEKLKAKMGEYERRMEDSTLPKLSDREESIYNDMKIVLEMYVRGFDFLPIDIYKAKATEFIIIDGKIMPCFTCIEGLGEKVAIQAEEAAKDGPYLSKQNFQERTKIPKTVVEKLSALGILDGLREENQMSLFDFFSAQS